MKSKEQKTFQEPGHFKKVPVQAHEIRNASLVIGKLLTRKTIKTAHYNAGKLLHAKK